MPRLVFCVVIMAALSGVAHAQPGLSGGNDLDAIDKAHRIDQEKQRERDASRNTGLEALQAQDFTGAERNFAKLLTFDPTTSDANYLMGLAQIGLKKWPEAKVSLETAVKLEPKRPEPKARLGVAHVMLGDINSAADQHDALGAMARECNGCPDQKNINDNLLMLDRILVAATKPKTPG
jgi:Flp pilus assembly protein TadD